MAEDKNEQQISKPNSEHGPAQLGRESQTRRQFNKTALTSGVVLASLASRPALGTGGYGGHGAKCTVSILYSLQAGSSLHPDNVLTDCKFGCDHHYWKSYGGECEWRKYVPPECRPQAKFKDVFGMDWIKSGHRDFFAKSLWDIVKGNDRDDYKVAAKIACSALLNCVHINLKDHVDYNHWDVYHGFNNAYKDSYKRRNPRPYHLNNFSAHYGDYSGKICPLPDHCS